MHGHTPVMELLIAARCNVDHQNDCGLASIHLAAIRGFFIVAKQLVKARCNVNLKANDSLQGLTALQFAQTAGHAGIVTLIQNRNKKQETPLLFRRVVVNGLVAKPELNGRTGTVISFDGDKGRYSVELSDCFVMIKPCNLLPTTVCGGPYVA